MNLQDTKDYQDYWRGKVGRPVQRICNLGFQWLPSNYDPLTTIDAEKWAAHFLQVLRENPEIIIDHDFMLTWFSNAIMRGYDERCWQSLQYKRSIRRALFSRWNWRHYAIADWLSPKLRGPEWRKHLGLEGAK